VANIGGVEQIEIEYTPEGWAVLAGDPCVSKWVRELKRLDTDWLVQNPHGIRQFVWPDWVIVDVGAYIGDHTWAYAGWVPQGQVFAFEPQSEAYRCCLHNCRACQNVTVVRASLGDTYGARMIFREPTNYAASHVAVKAEIENESADLIQVPLVTTLDSFFASDRVNLIKVDVEGFEGAVLRGGERLLRRWRPLLLFEVGTGQQKRYGHTVPELLAQVEGYGYRLLDSDCSALTSEKRERQAWDCIAVPTP